MNLTLIPLLVVALMLATTDSDVDTVEVVLSGQHQIEGQRGDLIVGDAQVTVPADTEVPGPIYVIGGELTVAGAVATDVIQLAGTVTVGPQGMIGDELRLIGGSQSVSSTSEVGRRTSLEVNPAQGNPATRLAFTGILALLLAWVGARLTRSRRRLLDNITDAVIQHYVVSFTVGTLLTLTAVALFVFMAFTLILIPIALVGIVAGLATLGYGVISWGYVIGTRLPVHRPGLATGLGVAVMMIVLQLAAAVPLIGGLVVLGIVLNGAEVEERLRQTSLYRADLDLVVLEDDGRPAAYGLFWFDPETGTGLVEPMRTEDDHQRRGLARHVLTAGIDRLVEEGADRIKIAFRQDNPAARNLYTDVGFRSVRQCAVVSRAG